MLSKSASLVQSGTRRVIPAGEGRVNARLSVIQKDRLMLSRQIAGVEMR